jgi:hypothetical protein
MSARPSSLDAGVICFRVSGAGMKSKSDLEKALRENLKLRRELAAEVAEAKGKRLAFLGYPWRESLARFRYAFYGKIRSRSAPAAVAPPSDPVKEPRALKRAREQYIHQLRQLDKRALRWEIERLRRLLGDLAPPPAP